MYVRLVLYKCWMYRKSGAMVQLTSKCTARVVFWHVFADFIQGTSQISRVTSELKNWIVQQSD